MLKESNFYLIFLFLRFLRWLTEYIYLPLLPLLLIVFHSTRGTMQFSWVIFLMGMFFSQLIGGYIAFFLGNRNTILLLMGVSFIGTLIILPSSGIDQFLVGRFFQGLGIGVAISLGTVLIHEIFSSQDKYHNRKTAIILSYTGILTAWFPGIAMVIGSLVSDIFHWKGNFFLLLVLYICFVISAYMILPANVPKLTKNRFKQFWKREIKYHYYFFHKKYRAYAFSIILIQSGITAYYLSSVFIFHETYHLSSLTISYLAIFPTFGHASGKFFSVKLSKLFSRRQNMMIGLSISLVATILMVIGMLLSSSFIILLIFMLMYSVGAGILEPQVSTEIMTLFHEQAAHAQSLLACIGTFSSIITSTIVIYFHPDFPIFLSLLLLCLASIAFFYFFINRIHLDERKISSFL